ADFSRADGAARAYVRGIDYLGDRFLVVESVLLSDLNAGSIEIATLLTMIGNCHRRTGKRALDEGEGCRVKRRKLAATVETNGGSI
ncbi:hypothetical protein ACC702_38985, partial [Rhizobium ruizarguesonis]